MAREVATAMARVSSERHPNALVLFLLFFLSLSVLPLPQLL